MTRLLPFPVAGAGLAGVALAWGAASAAAERPLLHGAVTAGAVVALVGVVGALGRGLVGEASGLDTDTLVPRESGSTSNGGTDSRGSSVDGTDRTGQAGGVPLGYVAVLLVAGVAAAGAWWAVDRTFGPAVAVVVAAAPTALSLAGSLPLRVARARGRQAGVAIARYGRLDVASRVDVAILDRWGTVTTGDLKVTSVKPVDPDHDRNLRWFAGALEHAADDPVGRAIARLSTRGRLSNVERHPGRGISGSVDRHPVRVGQPRWIGIEDRNGLGTTVAVEVDGRALGHITVADDVRADARAGVERLRRDGIDPVLVSDDTSLNTEHLAEECGIEHWHPETAPEKRERLVVEHQERGRVVAVAGGGGGNDEALAAADLALSDHADPPVDMVLTDLDVGRIGAALALARSTRTTARLGHRLAVGLGLLGIGLASAGLLAPLLAAGYAAASCLVVAAVALRVRT
jgi:P-type E1-E2 ATPase